MEALPAFESNTKDQVLSYEIVIGYLLPGSAIRRQQRKCCQSQESQKKRKEKNEWQEVRLLWIQQQNLVLARKRKGKKYSTSAILNADETKCAKKSLVHYRIVISFTIWLFLAPIPPSRAVEALVPALRSNTFQNFKLSSAARFSSQHTERHNHDRHKGNTCNLPAVASICPSGLRQLCRTRVSWAGISILRIRVG